MAFAQGCPNPHGYYESRIFLMTLFSWAKESYDATAPAPKLSQVYTFTIPQ